MNMENSKHRILKWADDGVYLSSEVNAKLVILGFEIKHISVVQYVTGLYAYNAQAKLG